MSVSTSNAYSGARGEAPGAARAAFTGFALAVVYTIIAKACLTLASINPSATPFWPPTGIAIAALLVFGPRYWWAIALGAWVTNATTAGSLVSSAGIAFGNTLEALIAVALMHRWTGGSAAFQTPMGIAKFAVIVAASCAASATIGVASLAFTGFAEWRNFADIWRTWYLGDLAGALVIAPLLVLWRERGFSRGGNEEWESAGIFALAAIIGLTAFSPFFAQSTDRNALAFLAVVPLMWAALRGGQRDTATASVILYCFAAWGAAAQSGPFHASTVDGSFLLLIAFILSTSVPSLALSASIATRKETERQLRLKGELLTRQAHRAQASFDRSRAELVQIQKMDAIGQLSGGIAHDFNNLLTAIKGNFQLIERRGHDDIARYLAAGKESVDRAAQLTQQLLAFSRRQTLDPKPTDANALVRGLERLLADTVTPTIQLNFRLNAQSAVFCDPVQMEMSVLNLAINARDAMPEGGILEIETTDVTVSEGSRWPVAPGRYVALTVRDTGTGMDDETRARALEPFFTTKPPGQGTGLGLSVIFRFVHQSRGYLDIDSALGKGTTVSILMPRA